MSKHGKELERKFEEQERQRRVEQGKPIAAPEPKKEEDVPAFNVSEGARE
jgi:hypothetical protein